MTRKRSRIAKTVAELAEFAGVSLSTAKRWKRKGAPKLGDGTFDVDAVVQWHRDLLAVVKDRSVDVSRPPVPNVPDPLREARAARERIRVELEEIALRRLKGEIIERDHVATMLVDRARVFKRALRSMGRRLARQVARLDEPREVQRVIERAVDEVLRQAYGGDDD